MEYKGWVDPTGEETEEEPKAERDDDEYAH
jgi:hypothetical protein